jgi:acetyl-CoA acetyltransferase
MSLKDRCGKGVLLTGWGHSRFGKLTEESLEALIIQVASEAAGTMPSTRVDNACASGSAAFWP